MLPIQTITRRVSVAFTLQDAVTGRGPISPVNVRLAGVNQEAFVHPDGYVLFLDLPDGDYSVIIESNDYYLTEPVTFNPATASPIDTAIPLVLGPRPAYPFADDATLLRGTILSQFGQPVAGVRAEVTNGPFENQFAISDASGRLVFSFDLTQNSRAINLRLTRDSFQNKTVSTTILLGETVEFNSEIIGVTGANIAVVTGSVVDAGGFPISQAQVNLAPWGLSTISGPDGRFAVSQSVSGNVGLTMDFSQDGYADLQLSATAIQGDLVDVYACLNLNLLPDTACLEVRVREGSQSLEGALVEVVEKNRSTLTAANGTARFYFNDLVSRSEFVTLRVSKPGYQERVSTRRIRQGSNVRPTIRLNAVNP